VELRSGLPIDQQPSHWAKTSRFIGIGAAVAILPTFLLFLGMEMHINDGLAIISEAGNAGNNGALFSITWNAEL
jgi:hypothetical protein